MAVTKKSGKEELLRSLFLQLAPKWDIHDREGARTLTRHCLDMVDGFYDVADAALGAPKKPEKLP